MRPPSDLSDLSVQELRSLLEGRRQRKDTLEKVREAREAELDGLSDRENSHRKKLGIEGLKLAADGTVLIVGLSLTGLGLLLAAYGAVSLAWDGHKTAEKFGEWRGVWRRARAHRRRVDRLNAAVDRLNGRIEDIRAEIIRRP